MGGALTAMLGRTGASGPWTPDALGGDLQAWWDPELGITFNTAPSVKWWDDVKNNRRLASNGASVAGLSVSQNGHFVMQIEALNNYMSGAYTHTGTQFMLCSMMRYKNAGSSFGRYFSHGHTATANDFGFDTVWQFARTGTTTTVAPARNGTFGSATPGYDTWFLVMMVFDGVDCRFYINGVLTGTPLAKTAAFATSNLAVCSEIDSIPGQANGQGRFGDIITMHRAPTMTEREKIEGWFCHKWGQLALLDVSHPYKTNPPTL